MRPHDAIAMLADGDLGALGPTTWADLGCGTGTFTLALAELLAAGSLIHALDRDARALRRIPPLRHEVAITTHGSDFITTPWPFTDLDGILMANALHFVGDQAAFIRGCQPRVRPTHRFLIVEYDTDVSNPWVRTRSAGSGWRTSLPRPATPRSGCCTHDSPSTSARRSTPR